MKKFFSRRTYWCGGWKSVAKIKEFQSKLVNNKNTVADHFCFVCAPVTEEEVYKLVMLFKNKYSTGSDDIPMPVLKHTSKYWHPLAHLISYPLYVEFF